MNNFDLAINLILDHEGGYVNNPKDPGGETKFGISKRAYPNVSIKDLTKDQAKAIYKRDYWDKVRGDKLNLPIAIVLCDMAVNMGVNRTVKMLQEIGGVKVDGIFGDKTLSAILDLSSAYVVEQLTIKRLNYYMTLPTFQTFGKGWTRRSVETCVFALSIKN